MNETQVAELRARVAQALRDNTDPGLSLADVGLLLVWYERELERLNAELAHLGATVDLNYAERLDAERASMAAVDALDRATTGRRDLWDHPTATPLGDAEGPTS